MELLFRVACNGGSDEPLNIHLKRITDSAYTRKTLGAAEIDGDLIAPVIQESHDGDGRREIMRHVRECLSESGKRWQRIYGALSLIDKLMMHGSAELMIEVAHGHHFDLVQKVSFLEHFDAAARGCTDRRAQSVVRSKASQLLGDLVPQLEKARSEELPQNAGLNHGKDTASICSKDTGTVSTSTGSTAAISSAPSCVSESVPSPMNTPQSSIAVPPERPDIHAAFDPLREWMDATDRSSVGYSSGASALQSPRTSEDGDSDWEPIGKLRVQTSPYKSDCGDESFFTPLPTPALALTPSKKRDIKKDMMSL